MCGIMAVAGSEEAAAEIYMGMIQLQHRGQDACGITTCDVSSGEVFRVKDVGLVSEVFSKAKVSSLKGTIGIGQTRYPTIGVGDRREVQPFFVKKPDGLGLAFNGNVVNYPLLKKKLREERRVYLTSNSDAEVMLQVFADEYEKNIGVEGIFNSVKKVHDEIIGGYAVVMIIANKGILAFKDPNGIRPMVSGEKYLNGKKSVAFASESTALAMQGYSNIVDLKPGEAIFADDKGNVEKRIIDANSHAPCVFEWVYFSTVESVIEGKPVYEVRKKLGEQLAEKIKKKWPGMEIDLVMPVPDTSRPAANSLARALGVPYEEGLIKNRYIGRTFIMPVQKMRDDAVKLKLNPVESTIKGKNVMVVDDSIVRGTTSRRIVKLLRNSGAKKVYFLSTFPPIISPCFYGIDFQRKEELIAANKTIDEVEREIGADKLIYMDVEGLEKALGTKELCTGCLTEKYPTSTKHAKELAELREKHIAQISGNC
ncbi:amidophosphoribosyltransferase [Candidatus Woesearchaeota archaeon]|nr:amidophosphoribosyltransferase [Candidatus Woesearchaeota archaeon]